MGTLRESVAARSRRPLAVLSRQPRWLLPAVSIALLLLGLFAHGLFSAVPLLVLGAFLLWLGYLSWPAVSPGARVLRVLVVLVLFAAGAYRLAVPM